MSENFFFKNWNSYPIVGSELVKTFEKWGWKMFLLFFGFHHIWGSELVKMFGKCGWKMFLRFCGFYLIWGSELVKIFEKWGWNFFFCVLSALINVKLCETSFWVKKVFGKNFFKYWNFYPIRGSELVKIFEKWGCFCVFSAFTLYGDQNL